MGRIPQTFIDELLARTDIVELVGSRVPLKKAGHEFKACCPFHSEKTPSFWVSPAKQFYHCFGCGAHGTALGFVMNFDRLSFPEAVEELATRLGIDVPRELDSPGRSPADEDLYELMGRVARFYAEALSRDARARAYVTQRGLGREILDRFMIGYAPDSWNEILRRFGPDESRRQRLLAAGLIVERERTASQGGDRCYDRFRDRIMFPIRDARGRVIAFGGRVIDQGEPKYLNSPETPLFHKGRELYALHEARQLRAPLRRLLVVEGYMDAVRLHQAGIAYAVATLGTATTAEHLKRIFRVVSEVVFAFDGDRAGRAAAWRALQNALPEAREGREIRFLFLPEGEDPDSLVGTEGREAFEQRLDAALPLSEYLVHELSGQAELSHADGRARFAELARPLAARVPDGLYRELLLERLARAIRLPPERLLALWTSAAAGTPGGKAGVGPSPVRPARARESAGRGSLVRQAVRTLLHFPGTAQAVSSEKCAALAQVRDPGVEILRELLEALQKRPAQSTAQILERWREHPAHERLARLAGEENLVTDPRAAAAEFSNAVEKLLDSVERQRIEELLAQSETGLGPEEELELRRLMSRRGGARPAAPGH